MKRNDMKNYRIPKENIIRLIPQIGGGIATDKIMVEGARIGYMYREKPINNIDSGWRFFEGNETSEYIANNDNSGIYELNTIANYDPSIIEYLDLPYEVELERIEGTNNFEIINSPGNFSNPMDIQ